MKDVTLITSDVLTRLPVTMRIAVQEFGMIANFHQRRTRSNFDRFNKAMKVDGTLCKCLLTNSHINLSLV